LNGRGRFEKQAEKGATRLFWQLESPMGWELALPGATGNFFESSPLDVSSQNHVFSLRNGVVNKILC